MKKLLTFGCSYTDESYITATMKDPTLKDSLRDNDGKFTEPFSFWPTLLAEHLGMKLENHSSLGIGNDIIGSMFTDVMSNKPKDVGLVVIMWSEFMRIGFEQYLKTGIISTKKDWFKINITAGSKNDQYRKKQLEVQEVLNKNSLISMDAMLNRSLRIFYNAQSILENLNIPYRMVMGMPPCRSEYENKFCKSLLKSQYYEMFDPSDFIGWPMWKPLDGFSCASKLYDMGEENFINVANVHPSEIGQKNITDLIITGYNYPRLRKAIYDTNH